MVIWKGLSLIDGKTPVACIMTGHRKPSDNGKTGAMVQTYIIRSDMHPFEAVDTRQDVGICGGCVHRKQANGTRTCYVNIIRQGPAGVYNTYRNGKYPEVSLEVAAAAVAGKFIRFGAYGDPAAVPATVWQALANVAAGHTGYTHQWRNRKFAALASLMQASCETDTDVQRAHKLGYAGTYRVIPEGEAVPDTVLHCPASKERGALVQCVDCLACNGTRDVAIYAHGTSKALYTLERSR